MSKKPNIIFIMTDTQSTNMVGCYAKKPLNTQNIDKLAEQGYRFDSAYSCAPVCTPARAGLFTGIYASESGPWTNSLPLGQNISTMGRYFKDSGYNTCYIGKWHLDGHDYFGTGVCPEEWDAEHWYDGASYLGELNDHQIDLWRNGLNTAQDLRDKNIDASFTWGYRISERAISYIDKYHARGNSDQPFLMVLSYDEPHHPFTCPAEYIDKYEDFYYELGEKAFDDLSKKPKHQQLWSEAMPAPVDEQGRYHNPLYFACNDFVDDQIGRVIKTLDQSEFENTWVVYTSDHGEMMGAHKLISKGATGYDDITQIPLIFRPPKDIRKDVEPILTPVSHIDVLPTLMALADINKPDILPGENMLNFVDSPNEERGVMIEFNRFEITHDSFGGFIPMRVWVEKGFKLVINLFTSDELYNRLDDTDELHNLIDVPKFAEIRDQMHDRLLAYMEKIRDPFRTFEWSTRPWRKDKKPQWMGSYRPRPQDGYSPVIRDYDTGMPSVGVKVENKKQKF